MPHPRSAQPERGLLLAARSRACGVVAERLCDESLIVLDEEGRIPSATDGDFLKGRSGMFQGRSRRFGSRAECQFLTPRAVRSDLPRDNRVRRGNEGQSSNHQGRDVHLIKTFGVTAASERCFTASAIHAFFRPRALHRATNLLKSETSDFAAPGEYTFFRSSA